MASRFFTDAERARLSRFPDEIPIADCITAFTLSPEDLVETRLQRGSQHRLGIVI